MTTVQGHAKDKYITGRQLASSFGRDWRGILVERWQHAPGILGPVKPRDTEVAILINGALRVTRRGDDKVQQHDAIPGTIWLCPAGIGEDMIHLSDHVGESLHLFLPASPLSTGALDEFDIDPATVQLRYDGGFHDPFIEQIALAIRHEMQTTDPGDRLMVESLTAALALQLFRHHSSLPQQRLTPRVTGGALAAHRLRRVRDYVEANLDLRLGLEALAKEACLSPYHFARAFKAAVGLPPHQFVTLRRVERAKVMLRDARLSLAEIALSCGFSSQAHFTRCFRQVVGATPGVYRAE